MYLKQHYPLQFMCAALQVRSREIYIKECKRLGIIVHQPDVNKSEANYSIKGDSIMVGLSNIKHLGKAKKILANRPYRDEFDVLERAKPGKKALQALVYGGALDGVEDKGDRAQLAHAFCDLDSVPSIGLLAMQEKEHLGFYLVHDPLGDLEEELRGTVTPETRQPAKGVIGGMVSRIHVHEAKTGPMAFVALLTNDGEMDTLVWPSDYGVDGKKLVEGNIIIGQGKKLEKGNYSLSKIRVLRNA
jgi:DNA polymerase-3 subunit alpha